MSAHDRHRGCDAVYGYSALLAVCILSCASSALSAQTRQFQNWIVGCDNTNVCTAVAFAEPSKIVAEPGIPFIEIRHHPHRDATPMIRIIDPGPRARERGFSTAEARLIASPVGAEVAKGPYSYRAVFEGAGGFRFKDGDAWSILNSMRSNERINVSIGNKRNLRLLTEGLEAALAYIDSEQDLAGTPGALVKPQGGTPADYVHPKAPEAPTVEGAAFGELTESHISERSLPSVPGCSTASSGRRVEGYPLRGTAMLLMRDCDTITGNARTAWYMLPTSNARPVPFNWPDVDGKKRQGGPILSNGDVLPNNGMVRSVRYLDQTDDCGIAERWAWTKAGKFQLIERKEMPVCRTAGDVYWITTYRADFIMPN